jgi:uncharacterized protein (DUF427 family)
LHSGQGRRYDTSRTERPNDLLPYKGNASYYRIPVGGERSISAIWTYETPDDAVAPIKDYLAF